MCSHILCAEVSIFSSGNQPTYCPFPVHTILTHPRKPAVPPWSSAPSDPESLRSHHCSIFSLPNRQISPSPNIHISRMRFLTSTTPQTYSLTLDVRQITVISLHPFIQPAADENMPQEQNVLHLY